MGNFYTNLVVPSDEIDRVVGALEAAGRTAYVATTGGRTFVYDEGCETQDLSALRDLAKSMSKDLGRPVLTALNHDDDVLWVALAEGASVTEVYNSDPAYFDDGEAAPEIRDVPRLCKAFGVPERALEVTTLFKKTREDFVFEVDRHEKLLELLNISTMGLAGFNYLSQGESPEPDVELRAVGNAEEPDARAQMPSSARGPRPEPSPEVLARVNEIRVTQAALMLGQARIPAGAEAILPEGKVNAMLALQRVQQHILSNGLVSMAAPGMPVRSDEALKRLFGDEEFRLQDVTRLVVERLDVWSSLSEQEIQAIKAGSPEILQRLQAAAAQLMADLTTRFKR
jgi:hypothetical protein